ncbi:MAG: urate hydroxylase PuuD, partial [Pyrinomonadaceae bacterium]|nr:urate hydroxylase PuuD [Pyrinomonadaceae bacterium]
PAQRKMIAAAKKNSVIKQCPKCNRTYSDESLTYCLADGALLSAPRDSQATAQVAAARNTDETPTEVFPSDVVAGSQALSASSTEVSEDAFSSTLAARAKLRSKHNTFMAVPVVFLMISNHYPVTTYGHDYNWVVLSIIVLLGWGAAKIIRRA